MFRVIVNINESGKMFPPPDWDQRLSKVASNIGKIMMEDFKIYPPGLPPSSSGRYWERLYGWRNPDDPISEKLKEKWTLEEGDGEATLHNSASYAGLVHSTYMQWELHSAHGWQTVEETWNFLRNTGDVEKAIREGLGEL